VDKYNNMSRHFKLFILVKTCGSMRYSIQPNNDEEYYRDISIPDN